MALLGDVVAVEGVETAPRRKPLRVNLLPPF